MADLTPCPDCGHECSTEAFACPGCGRRFHSYHKGLAWSVAWGVILAWLIPLLIGTVFIILLGIGVFSSLRYFK